MGGYNYTVDINKDQINLQIKALIFKFSIQKFLVNAFLTAKIRFNLTSKKKNQTSEKIENIIGFMILNKAIYFLFIFFAGLQENTFLAFDRLPLIIVFFDIDRLPQIIVFFDIDRLPQIIVVFPRNFS